MEETTKIEHKHDLIDLNAPGVFGRMGEPAWACKICNNIITEKCKFCGNLPCTEEKVGCLHD